MDTLEYETCFWEFGDNMGGIHQKVDTIEKTKIPFAVQSIRTLSFFYAYNSRKNEREQLVCDHIVTFDMHLS